MRGFGKRLALWTLCICLLCLPTITVLAAPADNCPGGCTHQAAIGTTHYDTLAEALSAAADGSTVTVLADITVTGGLTIDTAITLDLGGKTLSGQKNGNDAFITVNKGCTVKNGTLTMNVGCTLRANNCTVTIEKDAVLTGSSVSPTLELRNGIGHIYGTVSGTGSEYVISGSDNCSLYIYKNATVSSDLAHAIVINGAGRLDITGGSIQAADNVITLNISSGNTPDLSITGGNFRARGGEIVLINPADTSDIAPADFITGGTYNKVPSAYIPAYCKVRDNGNNTYTVISSYTLTFQSGGASGTMASVTVRCGESYSLPQCGYTPGENMDFAGWAIDGKTYAAGTSFTPESDTVITAQWKEHVHYGGNATCLSPAVCAGCGNTYGQLGDHSLRYSGGYAASCDSTGMNAHSVCSTCGICFADGIETSSFSLSTPALGHQWKTEKAKAATCTEAGSKEHRICTVCGAVQIAGKDAEKKDLVITALGHTMETVKATQATCTQPGVQAHEHCTACNKLFQQKKEVTLAQITSALSSHVLGEGWFSDEAHHWKTCVDCDAIFRQSAHTDTNADNLCDDCGYAMADGQTEAPPEATGFSFLFLIPVIAAVAIAVPLAVKKRK